MPKTLGLLLAALIGAGVGVLIAGALLVFGVRGLFLAVPPLGGSVLGAVKRRFGLPLWVPVVAAIVCVPAVPAAELGQLRFLPSRIPLPPAAERLNHRAGLAGWERGPFGQVELRTAAAFEDVAAFYQAELAARGWRKAHCFTLDDRAYYRFVKRRSAMLIVIWKAPGEPSRLVEVTYYSPAPPQPRLDTEDCMPVRTVPM
jgi:hypothetical protein